jgi:hypothetical protein
MIQTWAIYTNAKTERAAQHLYKRLIREIGKTPDDTHYSLYPKNQAWQITFTINILTGTLNDQIVEAIALGQRCGYGWILTGDVHDSLEGWCNQTRIGGITSIGWQLTYEK